MTAGPSPDPAALARDLFGVTGAVSPLPGEHDLNARIDGADGRRILKLHAAGADPGELDLQDAALAVLAAEGAPTPRLLGAATDPASGRRARLLGWLDGTVWAAAGPPGEARLRDLGRVVAQVDRALAGLEHAALDRPYRWNLLQATARRSALPLLAPPLRAFVADALDRLEGDVLPRLAALPAQAIHNDANDHNVLVEGERVVGLIDVGDVVRAPRVVGLAVAVAYAMLGATEPVRAALPLVHGYHAEAPLLPEELALLHELALGRLAISIANAAEQARDAPANAAYLEISQAPIREAVARLADVPRALATAAYRDACGLVPHPATREVVRFLQSAACDPAPLLDDDPALGAVVLDWSRTNPSPPRTAEEIAAHVAAAGGTVGVGRYREERDVYRSDAFATAAADGERRTVHLGIDLFTPAGGAVRAPLDAVVEEAAYRPDAYDYGGVVLLRHETDRGVPFWLLVGHLDRASVDALAPGQAIARGEAFARVGAEHENGGWPPHPHVQLVCDPLGVGTALPGVVRRSEVDVWESICPDPNLLLRLPGAPEAAPVRDAAAILRRRRANVSPALSLSYAEPLAIVGGSGAHLVDADGRRWLDLVNNVCHVGHAHPRVVDALATQAAALNTNTRYLHPLLVEYARRLLATLPDPLSVLFLTNSGSEANDLALRLARTGTGREHVLALDWAYHGNLSSLIEISAYKFNRPGGTGPGARVRVCEVADPYRGRFGADGPRYAEDVERQAFRLAAAGTPAAAFIHESIPGCAGQVELAPGYLAAAYAAARAAGAVVIADEVQCGFGRTGDGMWAFEAHGVVPDVVTMGKPIGNGHPLGAVATTARVARGFLTGMEYFNTFGGNPVSCAVGLAVLDVLRDERLVAHAATVGGRLQAGLERLAARHPAIGDVRGRGLFLGVELVLPDGGRTPLVRPHGGLVEHAKAHGILLSTDGPHDNVLKLKPPLPLAAEDADRVVEVLDAGLARATP